MPHQMDNMLSNLDEIEEKVISHKDKISGTEGTIKTKIDDLQKLLESSDSKKEMLTLIEELSSDIKDDLDKLQVQLDEYPSQLEGIETTLEQMGKSVAAGDDYHEMANDISKHLGDLSLHKDDVEEMVEALATQRAGKDSYKALLKKSTGLDNLKKVVD